jgi:hypothetical protein
MIRGLFKQGNKQIEVKAVREKFKAKVKHIVRGIKCKESEVEAKRIVVMLSFYLESMGEDCWKESVNLQDKFSYEKVF